MQRDQRAYLWDLRNSIELIEQFTRDQTLSEYSQNAMSVQRWNGNLELWVKL